MASSIQSLRSLPLHELIGAPLRAMIEADAQAARATVEFVETVGFVADPSTESEESSVAEAGRLRMAEFRYKKIDEDNEISEFVASVPILSLLPVPALQIREGKVSFSANITDITRETSSSTAPQGAPMAAPQAKLGSLVQASKLQLITKPAKVSGKKDQEEKGTFHLEVEVTITQADIPAGLERIFDMMDQAITERKSPPSEAPA
jgi:hypothetical protein